MNLKKTLIATGAALVVAGGIVYAVLSPSPASSSNGQSIVATAKDSLLSQLHKRSFANKTASPKEDSIVNSAFSKIDFSKIDYAAPVVVTPPPTGGTTTVGTTASAPITLKSNTNYSGLIIDLGKKGITGITGSGVTNVTLTNCKILNGGAGSVAIHLDNCSNITIQNSFITMVARGLWVTNCKSNIKFINNQILNTFGDPTGKSTWHSIAYETVIGGGNVIDGNRIQNDTINARYTHDEISIYKCNGLPGDSIRVTNNMIWGNQFIQNGTGWRGGINSNNGADGIVMGDVAGTYQVCRGNILVYTGIMLPGGASNIKVDHNLIYSAPPIGGNGAGLIYLSGSACYMGFNQVNYTQYNGKNLDFNVKNPTPAGYSTNVHNAKLNASILPTPLITMK